MMADCEEEMGKTIAILTLTLALVLASVKFGRVFRFDKSQNGRNAFNFPYDIKPW